MSEESKDKLQTILPSTISATKNPNGHGMRGLVESNLRGSQNKKLSVANSETLPYGWTKVNHPNSGVYFVNKEKRLFTSSNVLQHTIHSMIMDGADTLQASKALQAQPEDQNVELVFHVRYVNGVPNTFYYCVSHGERRVFWPEDIGHEDVKIRCASSNCVKPKEYEGSMAHCVEAQYWEHCELFPTTFVVTKEITHELRDILLQAAADRLLVKFSTSPYDKNDLESMLNLVKEIEADDRQTSSQSWVIARFMALHNDGLLQSLYGQSDDYFDIDDKDLTHLGSYQHHPLLIVLGPLFLWSPDVYAAELYSFHESFTLARWIRLVNKVDQSIRDSNLLATVLLSTNMGFFAWTGGSNVDGIASPTAAQIVGYISTICSVGSIITGLAIFKQYRATGADTPLRAVKVLKRILNKPLGLESLAIICSLPYVLLMWGLIAFLVSFGIIFYQDTGIQVRIPVSVTLFLAVVALLLCYYVAGLTGKEDQKSQRQPLEETEKAPFPPV